MSFQPWKQAFNNLPNQFYRGAKNSDSTELSVATTTFGKMKNGDVEISGPPSNLSILSHSFEMSSSGEYPPSGQIETDQQSNIKHSPHHHSQQHNGTKFSIFSQLLNLNKINAFDNLLLNASLTMDDDDMNGDKRQGMRKMMEQAISDDAKQQIAFILEKISMLRPAEKLLLYLKMPGGHSEVDPLKQSQNPLGSRSEISHTINWVRSHLEQDDKVSIPKQEVYEDYVTFCGKINIKPLSTADFGKVMKQVFPDIRPRRLGTRGHSRYCYAAMRKATKLNPPQLPDLSTSSNALARNSSSSGGVDGDDKDDVPWNVIKKWSENLLGTHFDSFDDLATHIKLNNHMTSSSSSTATSKQILQKKLMQREMKERKRNINQQPTTIKRRRKKRRLSTISSPEHTPDFYANPSIQIKQEKETDGSAVENNAEQSENSSDVPMNLSNVKNSEQNLSTIAAVTSTASSSSHDAEMIKSILKNKLTSSTPAPQISPIIAPPSIEQKPEEHQFIYCKKVRQAQQMKMSANLNTTIVSSQQYQVDPLTVPKNPPDRRLKRESILMRKVNLKDDPQASQGGESNEIALKKDELQPLKEDFILPRERFISICNMDRNALDTYLNDSEENSQDLELLQYFDDDKNKQNDDSIEEDLGPATTSVPLLENYQLNFNDNKSDKQEKINQLRTILEEKHSTSSAGMSMDSPTIKNLLLKDQPLPMESPAVLNPFSMQQIQKHDQQLTQNYPTVDDKLVPQSPNTRRKNFSFVPISTQSRVVKNVNLMPAFSSTNNNNNNARQDSFVSPRVTPNNDRRPQQQLLNIRSPSSMSLEVQKTLTNNSTIPIPALGVNTAFCRPSQFKMEPLSAPPSPSTHFNFSPQAQHQQQQQHPQNQFQFQTLTPQSAQIQGTNSTNFNYPVESRSQSVPPHHVSNTPNNMFNYANYSQSACNSVAHTPVPSDYQEFTTDTNILEIFNNEQPPLSSVVKMETNDDVINDLLDNEILNQNSNTSDSTSDLMSLRQSNFNSRSVPSSPYQHQGNGYHNGMSGNFCHLGKSVPNTPIIASSNPFRYSPELQRTRDFLINGFNQQNNINHNNNVVIGKMNHKSDATIHHHPHHNNHIRDVLDSSNLLGNM